MIAVVAVVAVYDQHATRVATDENYDDYRADRVGAPGVAPRASRLSVRELISCGMAAHSCSASGNHGVTTERQRAVACRSRRGPSRDLRTLSIFLCRAPILHIKFTRLKLSLFLQFPISNRHFRTKQRFRGSGISAISARQQDDPAWRGICHGR